MNVLLLYSPTQPRAPQGSPEGGQWIDSGAGPGGGPDWDNFHVRIREIGFDIQQAKWARSIVEATLSGRLGASDAYDAISKIKWRTSLGKMSGGVALRLVAQSLRGDLTSNLGSANQALDQIIGGLQKRRLHEWALYDPNQPRRPKGDPEGGQWTDGGGGSATATLDPEEQKKKDDEEAKKKASDEAMQKIEDEVLAEYIDDPEVRAKIREDQIKALAMPQTIDINTPEREQIREDVANKLYGSGAKNKNREAYIVTGVPAAGKNKAVAEPLAKEIGGLIIDSDEAKEELPEYKKYGGIAANALHEESSTIIIPDVMERAIVNGDNIVMPRVGKTYKSLESDIKALKDSGYKVTLVYVHVPDKIAAKRAVKRYYDTGRLVRLSYIRSVNGHPRRTFTKIRKEGIADAYQYWDNSGAIGTQKRIFKEVPMDGEKEDGAEPEPHPYTPGDRSPEGEEAAQEHGLAIGIQRGLKRLKHGEDVAGKGHDSFLDSEPDEETMSDLKNLSETGLAMFADTFGAWSAAGVYTVQVMKTGVWEGHPEYGPIIITNKDIATMLRNYAEGQRKCVLDYDHGTDYGKTPEERKAAGWHSTLWAEDENGRHLTAAQVEKYDGEVTVRAKVEVTEKCNEYIKNGEFMLYSPTFHPDFTNKVTGKRQGLTLLRGAITNTPFFDGMSEFAAAASEFGLCIGGKYFKFGEDGRLVAYSPDQPRDPKGTPTGGQWTDAGGSGAGGGGEDVGMDVLDKMWHQANAFKRFADEGDDESAIGYGEALLRNISNYDEPDHLLPPDLKLLGHPNVRASFALAYKSLMKWRSNHDKKYVAEMMKHMDDALEHGRSSTKKKMSESDDDARPRTSGPSGKDGESAKRDGAINASAAGGRGDATLTAEEEMDKDEAVKAAEARLREEHERVLANERKLREDAEKKAADVECKGILDKAIEVEFRIAAHERQKFERLFHADRNLFNEMLSDRKPNTIKTTEVGHGGDGGGAGKKSAADEIEVLIRDAQKMAMAEGAPLPRTQAILRVMAANEDLAKRYRREMVKAGNALRASEADLDD